MKQSLIHTTPDPSRDTVTGTKATRVSSWDALIGLGWAGLPVNPAQVRALATTDNGNNTTVSDDHLAAQAVKVDKNWYLKHPPCHCASWQQQTVTWKLLLSPTGLRIDTDVADLYRILLNGISQLNIKKDSTVNLFSSYSIKGMRINAIRTQKLAPYATCDASKKW